MKNGPILLLGLFVALVISFGAIVLGSNAQLGQLTPYFDETEGGAYPQRTAGIAARGQQVYADLGCATCHTQQVRRPDLGNDKERGWGERQSVARDYIHQARPQLGGLRFGPDLTNFAARKPAPNEQSIYLLLYQGAVTHPPYRFLFEERNVVGEPSARALTLTGANAPRPGAEIVPTERARALAAYLLSLSTAYDYPESKPVAPPAKAEAAPAHAGHVTPIPAAAPDEKKKQEKK